jgi:predicted transcriptional regulator
MPTITVKLDKKQAAKLTRWARADKVTKSEIVRELINHKEPIRSTDDLIAWGEANAGRGLGVRWKKS